MRLSVLLQSCLIMASKCISQHGQLRLPSASLSSLDLGLQVPLQTLSITASKCIAEVTRSQSPSASPIMLDQGPEVHLHGAMEIPGYRRWIEWWPDMAFVYAGTPDNIRHRNTDCPTRYKFTPLKWSLQNPLNAHLESYPPRLCANSCSMYLVIVLHLILYFLLILPLSSTLDLHYSKRNLHPARWEITIHWRIKKHTWREYSLSRKQPIFIVHQMFAFQLSAFVHRIAND